MEEKRRLDVCFEYIYIGERCKMHVRKSQCFRTKSSNFSQRSHMQAEIQFCPLPMSEMNFVDFQPSLLFSSQANIIPSEIETIGRKNIFLLATHDHHFDGKQKSNASML